MFNPLKLVIGVIMIALAMSSAAKAHNHDPSASRHAQSHDKHNHDKHDNDKQDHGRHDHHGMAKGAKELPQSVRDYLDAMEKMHKDMAIDYSGNVDVDFMRGMIPHHQRAIDMANVLLKHSKDARVKRFAQGIIAAQTKEIRFMRTWLKAHEAELAGKEKNRR
jgi:uncharacterized protein (DUF305 family)